MSFHTLSHPSRRSTTEYAQFSNVFALFTG
jgi:hypothetical protein